MNLVLGMMTRCGDCPRQQGRMVDGAHCDCMHAESSYEGICGATREAEKGKANNVVPNVVSPALDAQNMATCGLKGSRDGTPRREQEAKCVPGRPVSHRLVDAGKWFVNLGRCGSACRGPIITHEGRSKRGASSLLCRSLWTLHKHAPRHDSSFLTFALQS